MLEKKTIEMSLHQYFVAFANTVASENAELHVLRMLPGISFWVVYTISFLEAAILLVRDGDDSWVGWLFTASVEVETNTTNCAKPDTL